MIHCISLEGLRGPSGVRYVAVSYDGNCACVPLTRISSDERGARTFLINNGIVLIGRDWPKFVDKVRDLRDFPDAAVIESVGWNGGDFVLPDGTVITDQDQAPSYCAIEVQHSKCSRAGTFSGWRSKVAKRLDGQHLATFVMMAAFMPPLLRLSDRGGNVGFEIVGPKGTGKSTLQYLMSSAVGGVMQDSGGHYWVTLDTTYNALEDTMRQHSDLPLIMDEANLLAAGASSSARADVFKALAFKLFSGNLKGRFGAPVETDYRLGYVISSNEPLASLLGQSNESARAAADRLVTLPIDLSRRQYGVFDVLPNGYKSSGELAQQLMRAARSHHGHAIRRFLRALVKERASNEAGLRGRIRKYSEAFQRKAGVDLNDGSAIRVAEAFGLVYAAGRLAQRYGVLPRELNVRFAALSCYRLHLAHLQGRHLPFRDRLVALATDERIGRVKKLDAPQAGALGYIYERKGELRVPQETIKKLFSDWEQIMKSREVGEFLIREGSAYKIKRRMPGKGEDRVYCFQLPT